MPNDFSSKLIELFNIIEQRDYEKLSTTEIHIPGKFNWVRDVFEPLVVTPNAHRDMLELVDGDKNRIVLLIKKA